MADDRLPRGPGDRAERALARAFREHARDHPFTQLDPDALARLARDVDPAGGAADADTSASSPAASSPAAGTPGGPARRRWPVLVAAAVVLVVVPLAGTWLARPGAVPSAGTPALAPAGQEDGRGGAMSGPAPEVAPAPPIEGPTTGAWATPSGQRWESMLDVAVLVPDAWGYGFAPKSDWCAEPGYEPPAGPFVDRNPPAQGLNSILCNEPMPDALRQTHLTWRLAEPGEEGAVERVGAAWVRVSRVIGATFLTVEVPAADEEAAHSILRTARPIDVDPRGCPTRLPDGRPTTGSLESLPAASEVAVCQYDALLADGPTLAGSYVRTGADAARLLEALRGSSVVPTDTLPACTPTTEELLLRFDGGARDARLPLDGCRPLLYDDGEAYRQPSRASCADLLVGPLWKGGFQGAAISEVCGP